MISRSIVWHCVQMERGKTPKLLHTAPFSFSDMLNQVHVDPVNCGFDCTTCEMTVDAIQTLLGSWILARMMFKE